MNLICQQRLSLQVIWIVLNYIQTVNSQILNVKFLNHNNDISISFQNSEHSKQQLLHICLSDESNMPAVLAVTESNMWFFRNYSFCLNELDIIVTAIVNTYFDLKS